MVGSAVTRKRPDKPGFTVTSTSATLILRSRLQSANACQAFCKSLQAGHHGAWLKKNSKFQEKKKEPQQFQEPHNVYKKRVNKTYTKRLMAVLAFLDETWKMV